MRWLITGSGGRLGVALLARLSADDTGLTGAEDDVVLPLDRAALDVTEPAAVRQAVADFGPDVVLNAAAASAATASAARFDTDGFDTDGFDTDGFDTDGFDTATFDTESEPESGAQAAYAVDAVGPTALAAALAATGGRLVHVSCDLVFAGDATAPYPVDAPTAPRSAHGRTKLAGELAVRELLPERGYVVRTSWLYGTPAEAGTPGPGDAEGFRRGAPTWIPDLAEGLITLARSDAPAGIYHCTNAGETTPSGLARAVRDERGAAGWDETGAAGWAPQLRPARQGPVPAYSVLSGQEWAAAGLPPLPDWRDALHRCFLLARDSRGVS